MFESETAGVLGRIGGLACPLCKADLQDKAEGLLCGECQREYAIADGIPRMITDEMGDFEEEVGVQDNVADGYESKRYNDKYARMYHDWWTDLMIKHITVKGRVLDNGCGVGHILERFGAD